MLLRVHTVPLDARDGNEAEPDDDHFSIVSGLWAGHWAPCAVPVQALGAQESVGRE